MTATEWPRALQVVREGRADPAAAHDHDVHAGPPRAWSATLASAVEGERSCAGRYTATEVPCSRPPCTPYRPARALAVPFALVANPTSLLKRLLLGRPFRSDRLQHTLLPKRIALPVFASDALSSVAYAPDEILLTLSIAGAAAYVYSPWVALAVVVVMLTVVASYRQNVHAYPSGGGDYEVATVNLGPAVRPRGGQRAAGRLRAHGGGVGLLRGGQPRLGRAVRGRAQGGHRGRRGGRC